MDAYKRLEQFIKELDIACEIVDVNAEDLSIEAHVKALGIRYMDGMGALLMKDKKGMYYCILRRDDRNLDLKKLKELLEIKKLSMVREEELETLGFKPGLMAPILLRKELGDKVKYIVDEKLFEVDNVVCGVGHEKKAMKIGLEEFLKVVGEHKVLKFTVPNPDRQDEGAEKQVILTGDRPTGKLHIGHYVGTLRNRTKLQDEYETFILIANIHALADNADNPGMVRENISELLCDYYATGLDFDKATVFIQSEVPEIHEIFMYLSNFATVQQLNHNPTLKTELKQGGMEKSTPLGFYLYPIHQAADILCVNADLVPVGRDQAPMIEGTRELARKFNRTYNSAFLGQPQAMYGVEKNLPGIDGNSKMGKSLNNAIYLSDDEETLRKKVFSVYTDPNRIKATDKGTVEGNVAFAYHDAFNENIKEVEELKERYRAGAVGDVEVKEKLFIAMNKVLTPIREKRKEAEGMKDELMQKALDGSKRVRKIARGVADEMKRSMEIKF